MVSLTLDPLPFSAWTGLGGVPPLPVFRGGMLGPGLGGVWGCRLLGEFDSPYPPLVMVSKIFVCVMGFGVLLSFFSFVIHSLSSEMVSDIPAVLECGTSLPVLR